MAIFGTRPEAIKMCLLILELQNNSNFDVTVCVTGQHREMLAGVLSAFGVVSDFDLAIMKNGQTLYDVTSCVLLGMKEIFEKVNPDVVLVHGDTTTSFAAALAAFYLQIPVGHVEAGLRTNDIYSPFPEEFNRQAVDIISEYYFAPTETAKANLISEGKEEARIYVTGNTGIDALATTVTEDYSHDLISWADGFRLVLVTAHRRENLGQPMRHMFRAIRRIVEEHRDIKVVYPVHLNPAVRQIASEELGGMERVRLVPPMDVLDFHNILARSYMVLTDSGGIQEEAPGLGKPVLVMRDTTERPEGVKAGTLKLVDTSEEGIYQNFKVLIEDSSVYQRMTTASNPYGDGRASQRIAEILDRQE